MKKIVSLVLVACLLLSFAVYNISADAPPQVQLTEEFIARADIRRTYEKDEESPYYFEKFVQTNLSKYDELYWLIKLTSASNRVVVKFDLNDGAKSFMPYLWASGDKCAQIEVEASKDGRDWHQIVAPVKVEWNHYYGDTSALGESTAWPNGINQENMDLILADNPTKEVYLRFSFAGADPDEELQLQAFGITAKYNTEASSIKVLKTPKTYYTSAEARDVKNGVNGLNVSTGVVEVTYKDGSVREYKMDDPRVTINTDYTTIATKGVHEVSVSVDGLKTSYNITTLQGVVKSIAVSKKPRDVFEEGDTVDVTGGELTVSFNGSKIEPVTIPISEEMISGFNTTAISDTVYVNVSFGGKATNYIIKVKEKSETKEASVRIDAQPYVSGEEGLKPDEWELQQQIWEEKFGPENNPDRTDLNLADLMKECTFSMSYLNGQDIWMDVFAGGELTLEIDLPDRAVSFELTRGWGVYANCKVLASKDNGQTWYIVGRVIDEVSAMDTVFYSSQLTEEEIAKNYNWILTGNAEKKFLLKFIPDMTEDLEGKVAICNLGYKYEYNKGEGNYDKDLPTTVPEDYEIPREYDPEDYPTVVMKFEEYDDFEDFDKAPDEEIDVPEDGDLGDYGSGDSFGGWFDDSFSSSYDEDVDTITNTPNKKVTKVKNQVKVIKEKGLPISPWLLTGIIVAAGVVAGAIIVLSAFGVITYIKKRKNLERKI